MVTVVVIVVDAVAADFAGAATNVLVAMLVATCRCALVGST